MFDMYVACGGGGGNDDDALAEMAKRLYNLTANPEKYPTLFDICKFDWR